MVFENTRQCKNQRFLVVRERASKTSCCSNAWTRIIQRMCCCDVVVVVVVVVVERRCSAVAMVVVCRFCGFCLVLEQLLHDVTWD